MPTPCLKPTVVLTMQQGHIFEAAQQLLALGPQGIGVKMGARGMRLLLQGEEALESDPCLSHRGSRSNWGR